MFPIDYDKLHSLESAFVDYERGEHGINPRETLEGTTLRIKDDEGYKQGIAEDVKTCLRADKTLSQMFPDKYPIVMEEGVEY